MTQHAKRSPGSHVYRRRRPVTTEEITLRRFSTIVVLFLLLLQGSESMVKACIRAPMPELVKHMQTSDPGIKFHQQVLNILESLGNRQA